MDPSALLADPWQETTSRLTEIASKRLARRRVRGLDPEDVVQETALRLLQRSRATDTHMPAVPDGARLGAYVRNITCEAQKRQKRRILVSDADLEQVPSPVARDGSEPVPVQPLAVDTATLSCLTAKQERAARMVSEGYSVLSASGRESSRLTG